MSLKDVQIKYEYCSLKDNMAKDFYYPLLSQAVRYDRSVGFFSSSALINISKGIEKLISNGGKIRIVASPHLSDDDIEAIRNGYEKREIIQKALSKELSEPKNEYEEKQLNYLANLIADGFLDIKVAVVENSNGIAIYHSKVGIIEDAEGNRVVFSGSMNETKNAHAYSYEEIDVFTSWSIYAEKTVNKNKAFEALWANQEDTLCVMEFSDVTDDIIAKYKKHPVDYANYEPPKEIQAPENPNDNVEPIETRDDIPGFFAIPKTVDLFEYQEEAIDKWMNSSNQGIFDMATGTGKTFTALGALSALSKKMKDNLAVVIVCPYQHLVEQWVEDIELFNVHPIVAYSTASDHNWKEHFEDVVNAYRVGVVKNFCIVTTNATFATPFFQKQISRLKKNACFVVDEAHNFGAKHYSELLPKNFTFRLALSATIDRHNDDVGTAKLTEYFGEKCISYTLAEAIEKGFLTSYYYYPVLVTLTDEELEEYQQLTVKIGKACAKKGSANSEYIEHLLIERARIIAGARNKVEKLMKVIKPYKEDNHMLVYCGATKYDIEDINDEGQIKQIEWITKLLYTTHGIKVRKFTADENKIERQQIKKDFQEGKDLQVITAIRCLDEGVNIPAIKRAFILASSTNPKEYVQRRGRVLRKFEGKEYAEIFDFITLPRPLDSVEFCSPSEINVEYSLVKREMERMNDFAATARNPFEIDELKEQINIAYGKYSINMEEIYE